MDNVIHMDTNSTNAVETTAVAENPLNKDYMSAQAHEKEKPYTFRKLNSTDLFPMIKIISKIGIDELTQVFDGSVIKMLLGKAEQEGSEVDKDAEENSQFIVGVGVALKVANKILEHIPSCEKEIYSLLAQVSGMNVETVKALDLDIFLEMIVDFVMKEEFSNFFKVASKYINR